MNDLSKDEESYNNPDPERKVQETFKNETESVSSEGENKTNIKELQINIDEKQGKYDWLCKSNLFWKFILLVYYHNFDTYMFILLICLKSVKLKSTFLNTGMMNFFYFRTNSKID